MRVLEGDVAEEHHPLAAVNGRDVERPADEVAPGASSPHLGEHVEPVQLEQAAALVRQAHAADDRAQRIFRDREPAAASVVVLVRMEKVRVVVVFVEGEAVLSEDGFDHSPWAIRVASPVVGDNRNGRSHGLSVAAERVSRLR